MGNIKALIKRQKSDIYRAVACHTENVPTVSYERRTMLAENVTTSSSFNFFFLIFINGCVTTHNESRKVRVNEHRRVNRRE